MIWRNGKMSFKTIGVAVKKLHEDAVIPTYANDGDAGFDFYVIGGGKIRAGETKLFKTGLAMAIPKGYELQVRSRSGLSLKAQIVVLNAPGTIDAGYRGEIGIILTNFSEKEYTVKKGDRVAQGVLNEVPRAKFHVVEDLPDSDRGQGGFGSSGK